MSVYEHGTNAPGVIDMTNVTIANNLVWEQDPFTNTGLVGGITVGDRVTGTWTNVTIVGNKAQFASGWYAVASCDRPSPAHLRRGSGRPTSWQFAAQP